MAKVDVEVRKAFRPVPRVQIECGEGLTEQHHKKACDMNQILADYRRTGLIKHAANNKGRYDDVSAVDFQEAMFIVTEAQQMFESLPGDIRKRFANDPAQFLGFVQNPDNKAEMAKLGILKGNDGVDLRGAQTGAPVPDAPPAPPEPPSEA